jgi:Zn-dependent protease with chaperone function/tetratricopeptide (TPR) repeat protein
MPRAFANRPAEVTIQVRSHAGGDVEFLVIASGRRGHFDFPEVARRLWRCDWQSGTDYGDYVKNGTCLHMLKTRDGVVEDNLYLAPLVVVLHATGFERVTLSLYFHWRPQRPVIHTTPAWTQNEDDPELQYHFVSTSFAALPPPVGIRQADPPPIAWVAAPLLLILLLPAVAAFVLRQREPPSTASHALLWMHWIQAGSWLFWLMVLPPGRIVPLLAWLPGGSLYLLLVAGSLAFSVPPLLAGAICFLILRARLVPEPEAGSMGQLLRRHLLPEVGLVLFFGLLTMSMAIDSQNWRLPIAASALGITLAVGLFWLAKRRKHGGSAVLERGGLRDRIMELARSAGVRVNRITILRNWSRGEANAAAWYPGRQIFITDSLLSALTKREADAVLAHEVGHFRDTRFRLPTKLCYTFAPLYIMCHVFFPEGSVWPESLLALLAFGLLLFGARVMRKREFRADQWAAFLTQDPLAMIAGLGRLAKLRVLPLDWGPIEGSILSHPSFRRRALSLARHCHIAEAQALAILQDPEVAPNMTGASGEHYDLNVECASSSLVFSGSKKLLHLGRCAMGSPALIVLLVFALASLAGLLPETGGLLHPGTAFLLGLPLVLWLEGRTVIASHRRFFKRTALAVSRSLPSPFEGELVALLPGEDLTPCEGFFVWDFGKLGIDGNLLVYFGERASFSVSRDAVTAIDVISRRVGFRRTYGVRIRTQDGAFIVSEATKGTSRRGASRLEHRWHTWWMGEAEGPSAVAPSRDLPPRILPVRTADPELGSPVRPVVLFLLLQFVAGGALAAILPDNPLTGWAVVAGPALYFLAIFPRLMAAKFMPRPYAPAAPRPPAAPPNAAIPSAPMIAVPLAVPAPDARPAVGTGSTRADKMRAEEAIAMAAGQLRKKAERATGGEADRLLAQARQECDKLLAMNPNHLLGLTVLFRVLTAQAPRQPRAEADVLYAQAEAACRSALVITPEDYNLMACLGATLIQRAKLAAGVETDRLLAQARQECDKLLETKRGSLMGQQLLSYVLSAQATRHSRAEADGIYAQAEAACASAMAMAPEDCNPNVKLMASLGHILLHRALLDPGEKGSGYLTRAREVLEETLRIRPAFDHARILWAHVLVEQSKRAPGEETDRALAEARASFDAAAGTTTDPAMVLRGIAAILLAQAMRVMGEDRVRLLREAKEKFLASETRKPGTGAYRAACVCARLGEVEECRHWLEESREPGILVTRGEIADETHFENVRQCDWFQGLVAEPAPPQS